MRAFALLALALIACGPSAPKLVSEDALDQPLRDATEAQLDRFAEGDALFDLPFRPADGLGPLYIRTACSACHEEAARGSGRVEKVVVVEADGETPSADQSALPYGPTLRPYYVAPATRALLAPDGARLKKSVRVGPPLFGRGYLEAIADSELERLAANPPGGRINRVAGRIGRFGLKARLPTLEDFTADAFQGDMGLTSPQRPTELPNPEGLTDDAHAGIDVDLATVEAVSDYLRLIEIPKRTPAGNPALFAKAGCDACHVPTLRTRADYPVAQLAGIDAPIYADLLLHDMGAELADGLSDEEAGPRDWRTAPLIGLRFLTRYLHDGRAKTIDEAISAHAGEAALSRDRYLAFTPAEREALVQFVSSL